MAEKKVGWFVQKVRDKMKKAEYGSVVKHDKAQKKPADKLRKR